MTERSGKPGRCGVRLRTPCSVLALVVFGAGVAFGEAAAQPAPPRIDTGDTAWMIVATALVMLIKAFVGLRVNADEETAGLDESQHGERAYSL
ncbi:MAG: ammonium transporter [Planctomycetes bacterium]|nr:ammonium transporter [Planctomycetota bacterium]